MSNIKQQIKRITLCGLLMVVCSATVFSQISLSVKNKAVREVIKEIEKKSDYRFFINEDLPGLKNKISLEVADMEIESVMERISKEGDFAYHFRDNNQIVISAQPIAQIAQQGQGQIVKGTVTDESGTPLIGANVSVKGTAQGSITDIDGNFVIGANMGQRLLITYIGYTPKEIVVGTQSNYKIILMEDMQALDEVVVIGYGTVKRANLGGAVSTADSKVFQSRPVRNAASALQGEIPGLSVIRTSGAPGSSPVLRVRDISSINGGSPLILIDGAEGDLNMINSADIDNISVLKDGTAAIYGARAADGVILITTKSGKRNQKLKISVDSYYSIKTPALLKKAAGLYEHASMALEITDGSFPIEYTRDELPLILAGSDRVDPASNWGRWTGYPKFYKNQDWNKHIIGNGNLQNYNVNLSGGGEKYTYLISTGYQNENGLPKYGKDNDKRYFIRAKSNIEIVKDLNYDVNVSYEASDRNNSTGIGEGQNIWELIYKTRSWAPLRNPKGRFYTFEGFDNPAQVLEEGGYTTQTTGSFTFNNQLKWQIIDGLNIIGRAIVRKNDYDRDVRYKMLYSYNWDDINHRTARKPNFAQRQYGKNLYKNFTLYAEYKKMFGADHDFGAMIGAANESNNYDSFWAKRINFDQQESMSLPLGSSENQLAMSEGNAWTINSFFGRLNYAYAGKYFLEATLRADGSSRFHADHRWGYFPGVNVAWRLDKEQFMQKVRAFDELKIRGSYGQMGNQSGIGLYDYIQLVSISSNYYPFGEGQKGQMASAGNIVSLSRTWETISTINAGLDFSTLDNRLYGSFDYFWKENKNMLIPRTYPAALGDVAPYTNDGHLKVNGWEVSIGWRDRIGNFSYSVRANLSDVKNTVVDRVGSNLITLGRNAAPKGYPTNSYFGYVFDGIIQSEAELTEYEARFPKGGIPGHGTLSVGDAKYKDLDGDGLLSVLGDGKEGSGDVVYLGSTDPRYTFGLNINAEYKGFDLGAFFQGVGKRTMFLEGEARMPFSQPWFQSAEYWYGKTWTAERTDARYPAITLKGKRDYNYYVSTNTKHNVAYVRLKNLQIGYTIPQHITRKALLEKVRVYFSGEDLFEIHNTPGGWDPEEGGTITSYPFARNFSLGVNLVF